MTRISTKRKLAVILFAIYISFILLSTIPYLAEQEVTRGTKSNEEYVSHLIFPKDGEYGHYKNVVLSNKNNIGKIDLKYTFETNTLFIQKIENIKELIIDCELMYENKYKEVFGEDPSTLKSADIFEKNNGLFTIIINTYTPMEKLQFLDTPLPKKVKVNKADWWETETSYYTQDENNITVTHIPKGSTTVEIYFKDTVGKSPNAIFTASDYIVLRNETITFDASGSSDEDGVIMDYIWNLGDTTKNIRKVITHSYSEIGNYTVTLTVRDNDGLVNVYSKTIATIGTDKSFKKVVVDEVEIDVRSVIPQNITIEVETEVEEVPESIGTDFGFFVDISSEETISKFQLKINLGPIGGSIIPAGTKPETIKLFYYDEDINKWIEIKDSYYDPKTGILTAQLDHLTVFAPMSKEASAEKRDGRGEEESGIKDIMTYVLIIVIVIIIVSIIGIILKKRRKGKGKDKGKSKGPDIKVSKMSKGEEAEGDLVDNAMLEDTGEAFEEEKVLIEPGGEPQVIQPIDVGGEPQAAQMATEIASPEFGELPQELDIEPQAFEEPSEEEIVEDEELDKAFEEEAEEEIEDTIVEFECPDCGVSIEADTIICPQCGAELEEEELLEGDLEEAEVEETVETTEEFECPDCGAAIRADTIKCPKCGAEFEEEELLEGDLEEAEVEETEEAMQRFECPDCGAAIDADTIICPNCGAEFEE